MADTLSQALHALERLEEEQRGRQEAEGRIATLEAGLAAQQDASGIKDKDLDEARALAGELRQRNESLERERDEARGEAAAQRGALGEALERERDEVELVQLAMEMEQEQARAVIREREAAAQALAETRINLTAVEGELYRLREALAEARKPFWRRWIG